MKVVLVWVLVAFFSSGHAGGPAVVSDLATRAECERLAKRWEAEMEYKFERYTCTQVRKVVG